MSKIMYVNVRETRLDVTDKFIETSNNLNYVEVYFNFLDDTWINYQSIYVVFKNITFNKTASVVLSTPHPDVPYWSCRLPLSVYQNSGTIEFYLRGTYSAQASPTISSSLNSLTASFIIDQESVASAAPDRLFDPDNTDALLGQVDRQVRDTFGEEFYLYNNFFTGSLFLSSDSFSFNFDIPSSYLSDIDFRDGSLFLIRLPSVSVCLIDYSDFEFGNTRYDTLYYGEGYSSSFNFMLPYSNSDPLYQFSKPSDMFSVNSLYLYFPFHSSSYNRRSSNCNASLFTFYRSLPLKGGGSVDNCLVPFRANYLV